MKKSLILNRTNYLRLSILLLVAILMTGCGTTTIGESACPPIKKYSKAEKEEIRKEVGKLDKNNILRDVVSDFINLRDLVSACHTTMKK